MKNVYVIKPNENVEDAELNYLAARLFELDIEKSFAYSKFDLAEIDKEIKRLYDAYQYIVATKESKILKREI